MVRSYGSAFVAYARDELNYKTDMTYNLLASEIVGQWDWQQGHGHGQPSVADDLRALLALTPSFHLMIAHGYSDMVTPFAVTRYVLDHLPPAESEERTQLKLYRGGHMFYLDPDSRKAFTADARTMYATP
jgi:carboxypeptidase C (cathepsin A)